VLQESTKEDESMTIKNTVEKMNKRIGLFARVLEGARSRHAALAPFTDTDAILAALKVGSSLSPAERGAIVHAILEEHRARGGDYWQSLLCIAFEPALLKARRTGTDATKKKSRATSNEDELLDQEILFAFTKAMRLDSVADSGDYAPIALVNATYRFFERAQRDERRRIRTKEIDYNKIQDDTLADCQGTNDPEAAAKVEKLLGSTDSELLRDVLMSTVAGDESLSDYIKRRMPGLSEAERAEVYQRLRRQRYNALLRRRGSDMPGEKEVAA
jgi:hypothetical protein